jgi:hypothetical protein
MILQNYQLENVATRQEIGQGDEIWKMYVDGSPSKEGSGASIVLIYPSKEVVSVS